MNKVDTEGLEKLRDRWERIADDVESLYGPHQPAANALRLCMSDLHCLIEDSKPKTPFKL